MKSFLEFSGLSEVKSPRDAMREAFAFGLIDNGDQWIDMMIDRNKTSHLYDESESRLIYDRIKNNHNDLLKQFGNKIEKEINKYN